MENLLERHIDKAYGANHGATIVQMVISVILGIVLSVGVALPITTNVIASANITDPTTLTVLNIVPVMVALLPVVLVSQLY